MNRTETYTGPWPRKRHSHTCVACKRGRDQGAVACYKSRCALPQQTESCECCCKLQPSVTYRPAAPAAAEPARAHLPACGFLKSGEDQTPCQCIQLRLAAALEAAPAPEPLRFDLGSIAQWYSLLDEKKRQCIFSALTESGRRQVFEYGLAVSWQRLPEYARYLVIEEWHNDHGRPPLQYEPEPYIRQKLEANSQAPAAQLDLFNQEEGCNV
jgi:hypothetical protein